MTEEESRWAIITAREPKIETAFLVCMGCGAEISTLSEGINDAELTKYFDSKGWTIKPTKCPKCRGNN